MNKMIGNMMRFGLVNPSLEEITVAVHPYSGNRQFIERYEKFIRRYKETLLTLEEDDRIPLAVGRFRELGLSGGYFAEYNDKPGKIMIPAGLDTIVRFVKAHKKVKMVGGFVVEASEPEERGCLGFLQSVFLERGLAPEVVRDLTF